MAVPARMRTVWKVIRDVIASIVAGREDAGERDADTRKESTGVSELPVPAPDGQSTDSETLAFLYEDARRVLDHQVDYLGDIDDKAMRSVRIITVLVAILLSAIQVRPTHAIVNPLTALGACSLLVSMGVGIFTYSASNTHFGPGSEYLDDVLANPRYTDRWRVEILRSYADWIENNARTNARNGTYLFVCQLLLYVGIVLLAVGIGVTFVSPGVVADLFVAGGL